MADREQHKLAVLAVIPAAVVLVIYELFLGHRHDYAGHYAAGYGATLIAVMFIFRLLSDSRFPTWSTWSLAPLCIASILVGVITEATIFRIAKFDEIDFCNQSFGAVLACMAALPFANGSKPRPMVLDVGLVIGIIFLGLGGCFAVA